jgi:hypothetical protein
MAITVPLRPSPQAVAAGALTAAASTRYAASGSGGACRTADRGIMPYPIERARASPASASFSLPVVRARCRSDASPTASTRRPIAA